MYEGREVFPNAPVELVAVEVRFPDSARLRQPETLDALQLALEDILPIRQVEQTMMRAVPLGGQMVSQQHEQVTLLLDRTSTTSATIRPTALTVETTHYDEFDAFREVVHRCMIALAKQRAAPGVERVGLRYVDEIRIPDPIEDVESWTGWVSDDLLAASRLGGPNPPSMLQGTIQFETGERTNLVVRYATLTGTGVVDPTLLRRRHTYLAGPFLVLDFDSYWQRPPDRLDEFEPERIMTLLDKLHAPVGETFQRAITDRLREVLRKQL
jgi:uncharacterized protein (TIGR04255 family)